jgi:hypothetical protein
MAKNNKPASSYAKPHTMSGKDVGVKAMNKSVSHEMYSNQGYPVAGDVNAKTPAAVVSIGANKGENMNGSWEFRGAGAATKGRKSYGPLA